MTVKTDFDLQLENTLQYRGKMQGSLLSSWRMKMALIHLQSYGSLQSGKRVCERDVTKVKLGAYTLE